MPSHRSLALLPASLLLGLVGSCGGGGGGSTTFIVATSQYTTDLGGILLQRGNWVVYFADEGLSKKGSLNADSDTTDRIAIATRLSDNLEFATGISPVSAEVVGDNIYFAVDEALDVEWGGTIAAERVLLRWAPDLMAPEFIAVIDTTPGSEVVLADGRLWFVESVTPALGDETNLRYIEASAPSTPVAVDAKTGTTGPVEVQLLGQSNGIMICALDESVNGDQNGDGDAPPDDQFVLALVEAGAAVPTLVSTQHALGAKSSPVLAHVTGTDAWRVLFLVSEAAQGATSLNNKALFPNPTFSGWNPTQCTQGNDTDTLDHVLHYLEWNAGDIVPASLVNTGLSGVAVVGENRLIATNSTVGLVAQESQFGAGSGCDLDGDMSFNDFVLRWITVGNLNSAGQPVALMLPIDRTLPGGGGGVAVVDQRFVVGSPKSFTIESVLVSNTFVHWLEPLTDTAWTSDLYDPKDPGTATPVKVAIDYLAGAPAFGRTPIGLLEASVQKNLNKGCFNVDKDGVVGDDIGDITDALATWLVYNPTFDRFEAAGVGWAVQGGNSGLVVLGNNVLFRVSEVEDGVDWNNDGVPNDQVLFRSSATTCSPTNMGTLNDIAGAPAAHSSGSGGAVYLVEEQSAGSDLNGSGFVEGFVIRYFRI